MSKFRHLESPYSFKKYYSRYPEGYSIYEALLDWLDHVNAMTDQINVTLDEWLNLKTFINEELKTYSIDQLQSWLDDGTLEEVINDALFTELTQLRKSLELKKANAEVPLYIPSYHHQDDHVVHPYVLDFEDSKYGYPYIMAYTPYSEARDRYENPSLVVSINRYDWRVPTGLTNPIIPQPTTEYHYSDPMLLDNGTELELWYRRTNKVVGGSDIYMVKTTDLINWTSPQTIFESGQLDTSYISPTGHKEGEMYKIWYRNDSGKYVLTESPNLITWSTPQLLNFNYGEYSGLGYREWHNEIKIIDSKYMAVVNTLPDPSGDLFLFESHDGLNFTLVKKIMEPSLNGFDSYTLYKASIIKYGNWYYLYYSAFAKDNSNHIGLSKATETLEFTGMRSDERMQTHLRSISGANGIAPVQFPSGIEILNGKSHFVESGVGGYHTETVKMDTMTIKTDSDNKKGYLDVAGLYLDSGDNDSIQGIYMDNGATYLNPQNQALTIHPKGTYKETYARFMKVVINASNGQAIVYAGEDNYLSFESASQGLKINLKNMPTGVVPHVDFKFGNAEGLMNDALPISYLYIREAGANHVTIGIKSSQTAGSHTPWANITLGVLHVCIIY